MARLSEARKAACRIGTACRERDAFAHDLLDADDGLRLLSDADRSFARLLVLGVAATRGTLDEAIDGTLKSPTQVKPDVRDALRVSTYELLFLDKQAHAAVDQGVQLVRFVQPRAAGVANHVLRRISEKAGAFPFGDPQTDDAALARLHGFPLWLAQRLVAYMGREAAAVFMAASNQPAPLFVGVNACAITDAELEQMVDDYGIQARRIRLGADGQPIPGCLQVRDTRQVAQEPLATLLAQGKLIVSDAAAQAIASLAVPVGMQQVRFLEVGAGRGTKTVLLQSQAARRSGSPMQLTCVDNLGFKAAVLRRRADACHVPIDRIVVADARREMPELHGFLFDACLVDAPCSGLGTLRRHPEIRWRLEPANIEDLAADGLAMLRQASRHVAPGGRLTYSTCTVAPEENQMVIKAFLESDEGRDFDIVPLETSEGKRLTFSTVLAEGGPDSHFACILRRA